MADSWLLWLGGGVAIGLAVLLALAGLPLVGAFLAAAVWLAARSAVTPDGRAAADDALKGACDRLPFCDCDPAPRR